MENALKQLNNRLVLIVITVICLGMIGVTAVRDEWLTPFRTIVGYVLTPVQSGVNRVGKALYNSIQDHERMKTALEDNRSLRERIDELETENNRLLQDQYELKRLRGLFEMAQDYGNYHMVGARIIAKDGGGWFRVFRIDKGTRDGIRVDMNVMANGGLIGIVTDVGANYATVRTIIDDVSRVSGMAAQSGDTCIVSGDLVLYEKGFLGLGDISAESDLKDGDRIVTSTVSAKFLPGILIGYAKDVKTDPSRLTKSGYLVPAADFGRLQEVLVVTDLKEEMTEQDIQKYVPVPETQAVTGSSGSAGIVTTLPAGTEPDGTGAVTDAANASGGAAPQDASAAAPEESAAAGGAGTGR